MPLLPCRYAACAALTSCTGWRAAPPHPVARSAGGTTPRSRRPGSPAALLPQRREQARSRRSASTARSARPRSRTTRPCRSSRRRARRPRRPGCARSSATVAAVPASAFWWQWPWKTIRRPLTGESGSSAQRAVVDRLDEQLLDEPRLVGDGLRARVAGQQAQVLLAQRQQARRLAADDRHAALGLRREPRRPSPRPSRAPGRAGPWRCSSARSSRRSRAARRSRPPRAARSPRGRRRAR